MGGRSSSRLIRNEYVDYFLESYWKLTLRTLAYCLLSIGGARMETIKTHIENQGMDQGFKGKRSCHTSPLKTSV